MASSRSSCVPAASATGTSSAPLRRRATGSRSTSRQGASRSQPSRSRSKPRREEEGKEGRRRSGWRGSNPHSQLGRLVLKRRFAGSLLAVGKYLGKSHTGEGGYGRSRAESMRRRLLVAVSGWTHARVCGGVVGDLHPPVAEVAPHTAAEARLGRARSSTRRRPDPRQAGGSSTGTRCRPRRRRRARRRRRLLRSRRRSHRCRRRRATRPLR